MAATLIIYSGGYRQYRNIAHEISVIEMGLWMPQTEDFHATALFTTNAERRPATDTKSFFGALTRAGPAKRIIYIGHGHPSGLTLSSSATSDQGIGVEELNRWHTTIEAQIKRLTKGKVFDLITCYAGTGTKFPKLLATEFGVTVRAFKGAVKWHVEHDASKKKITSRGLICKDKSCKRKIRGAHKIIPPTTFTP